MIMSQNIEVTISDLLWIQCPGFKGLLDNEKKALCANHRARVPNCPCRRVVSAGKREDALVFKGFNECGKNL